MFLRTVSGLSLAGAVGCLSRGDTGNVNRKKTGQDDSNGPVSILAAGSLQHAIETGLKPTVDVPIQVEAHGSSTVARLVAEGKRDPDIVSVADVALLDGPLSPAWHSVFASNAIVIAYNPNTEGGKRVAEAGTNWYEPLADGDLRLGRTDPRQDPLGYRTLFALELASRYYDTATNLRERVLERDQIYPETALISQFETGSIDAAFAYRNMAVERDYEYIDLPDEIDLSNPEYAGEWYSTVSYTSPSNREIRGGLIGYGSTLRHQNNDAVDVFAALTASDYLSKSGFVIREQFPTYSGNAPKRVEKAASNVVALR